MKVIAKARIVEAGALRLPGEVFEVDKERFKSLGDVVEEAPEVPEEKATETDPETDPERGPEKEEEKRAPKKLSALDRLRNKLGFKGSKVDLDISNLSAITIEDIEFMTMDQLNDFFAGVEGLELNPKTQTKGVMLDAIISHIEQVKGDGSKEDDTK